MKLPSSWIFLFCFYYTFMDILFVIFTEDRRFTSTIIQSFIFSTLLVAFFWYRKTAKNKHQ